MSRAALNDAHQTYLAEQQRGVLCTIGPDGFPQAKPVGFRYDPQRGTVDIGGYLEQSAKFCNVVSRPQVAFTIDDVPDPEAGAHGVRFLELRGTAEQVRVGDSPFDGLGPWIMRIHPERVVSYNVAGPGVFSADLSPSADEGARPRLEVTGPAAADARRAVQRQVDELQEALDAGDADVYNRRFAADVMWGSPYGATVRDYDTLHAIHARMHAAPNRTPSRYEIVRVLTLSPDVALAHVRRDELDNRGEPIPSHAAESRFAEMALYVLVRRAGSWWLAAGQNTRVNIDAGAVRQ